MLSTFYHHLRSHYPKFFFFVALSMLLGTMALAYFFATSNAALLNTLGMSNAVSRFEAGKEAAFWTWRAWNNKSDDTMLDPPRLYGYVESVNRDATVNISLVKGSKYETQRITLADLVITNPEALATIVETHRHSGMEFAFYPTTGAYPYVVAWLDGKPFNLTLITKGVAIPDRTPPTNIVDRLFASYYWKQFTR